MSFKGRCAVCNRHKSLCADHDHKTGAWRGRICYRCNTLLGFIETTGRGTWIKLRAYLKRFGKNEKWLNERFGQISEPKVSSGEAVRNYMRDLIAKKP